MAYRIAIPAAGESFRAEPGETLLAAAERAGVQLPHDCQAGGCGTCRIRLLDGAVTYDEFPFGLTPEEEAEGYALACQGVPAGDLVIAVPSVADDLPEPQRHAATVTAVEPACDGVTRLTLALPAGVPFDYWAGQYLNIRLEDGEPRSFSMASAPARGMLDVHVRRLPGGRFTDGLLPRLKPGDRLEVDLPLGSFVYRKADYRPLLMVATGTGIAPIRAILDTLKGDPDAPPVDLYWGMRTEADLYLDAELRSWQTGFTEFRYVPVLSRGGPLWEGRRGYVQDAVAADFDDLSEHAIYLCGSPAMIVAAKRAFLDRGASAQHIYAEGFTTAARSAVAADSVLHGARPASTLVQKSRAGGGLEGERV